MMVGREVLLRVDKTASHPGTPLLEVENLSVYDDRGLETVRDVSFEVRGGEIVGLAGVDANGQTELIDAITGLRHASSGRVVLDGEDITHASARQVLDAGIGHIPEDRHRRGLVLPFSLDREPRAARVSTARPTRASASSSSARCSSGRSGCSPSSTFAAARRRLRPASLSGGNQQKVVLAREIDAEPKVLIAAQPTRGLDVGAIEFVHRRLVEQRDAGRAVLLVSLELEEILSLSDRILVIYEGQIVGEFPPTATEEELGFAMTGGRREAGRERQVDGEDDQPDRGDELYAEEFDETPTATGALGASPQQNFASRYGAKAGGAAGPILTTLFAFLMAGVVVAVVGQEPAQGLPVDLRRHGPQLLRPLRRRTRSGSRSRPSTSGSGGTRRRSPRRTCSRRC